MKHGKKYLESAKLIESNKLYDPDEAVKLALQTAKTKFDETMETFRASGRRSASGRPAGSRRCRAAARHRQEGSRSRVRQGRSGARLPRRPALITLAADELDR